MFIKTKNLVLRDFTMEDSAFVVEMLNDPTYLKYIRDKNVRTLEDAKVYLREKVLAPIQELGFGYHVIEKDGRPIGMCGLMQRPFLSDPDMGFAFLQDFQNQGFGFEAISAYQKSEEVQKFKKLHAFTSLENPGSQKLLLKLGFKSMGTIKYDSTDEDVQLFTRA
jgi:RimJ/RimL family protein N-acetyltransferase